MGEGRPRRRRRALRIAAAGTALLAVALTILWVERKPIADRFIADALRQRGVQGRYHLARIGPRTQRIEDVVLGDPARPDLTADWVEVDVGLAGFGARVTGLRAGGVRLRGRIHDGMLDLGAVNKLMGEAGGEPALPDIVARLVDARARIETDAGPLDFALSGVGNMRSGFIGSLAFTAPRLAMGGCVVTGARAPFDLRSEGGRAILKGPLAAGAVQCDNLGLSLVAPRIETDLRADPALKDVSVALGLSAPEVALGAHRASRLGGLVTASGSAEQLRGTAAVQIADAALGPLSAGSVKLGGDFALRPGGSARAYSYAASLTAQDIAASDGDLLSGLARPVAGTPLEPLARRLAEALREASGDNRLQVSGRIDGDGWQNRLLVDSFRFDAASGAHAALSPGGELRADLGRRAWEMRGGVDLGGGGLPEARASLFARADGTVTGTLTMADYAAQDARLALEPVAFRREAAGALTLRTAVTLDGPLGDGAVSGLALPVEARIAPDGSVRFAQDCVPLRWTAVRVSSLALEPARFDLCGLADRAPRLGDVTLSGRIGESPLRLTARSARYALDSGRFTLAGLETRIGAGEEPVRLAAATLDGTLDAQGALAGTLAGATARIGPVPLDLSEIAGRWRFAGGALTLDGGMRVADRQAERRFSPLAVPDAHLTFAGGRFAATGTLTHPMRKVSVAALDIVHDLGSGEGRATFDVAGLHFGPGLQPDDLTPMALGVIANSSGVVTGSGQIAWDGSGVTSSTGTFATEAMDFAAAFGPVTGLATTIHFTDLLGMTTAPHQHLTVRQVSAGVDVFDGAIDYALLSTQAAQIEGGRWPFAGGTLELLPERVDMSAERPRHLTFRVVGLEAGAFINTLDLDNISATGRFDGIFPMVFDAAGGRIEGGVLVARQQGDAPLLLAGAGDALPVCDPARQAGTLSYVGAVSNAQLGMLGKLAFDALKNLRYKCLVIRLDGALDGEFVTQVAINGINQGTAEARRSFLARPFLNLPFIFNVRIEAPFRGLLNSAAAFADPTALIRSQIEADMNARAAANATLAVQRPDSDKGVEGNR